MLVVDQFFPFFIIENVGDANMQAGPIFPYDGILGFSPNVDSSSVMSLGVPVPIHLKNTKKIKSAIVAIDISPPDGSASTIVLGDFDVTRFRNKSESIAQLKWFSIATNNQVFAWRHEMRNVLYNMVSFDDGYFNEAVFDSFYSGIHLPVSEWVPLFQQIQKNISQTEGSSNLVCDFTTIYNCSYIGQCAYHMT